jgi:hypothetical protein
MRRRVSWGRSDRPSAFRGLSASSWFAVPWYLIGIFLFAFVFQSITTRNSTTGPPFTVDYELQGF